MKPQETPAIRPTSTERGGDLPQSHLAACVVLPELPIQLLRRADPRLRVRPIALVEQDRPDSPIIGIDHRAAKAGITLGMRLGAARSLVPSLFAALYPKAELAAHEETTLTGLSAFSPRVERAESGAYWLDPTGLSRLYGGPDAWARTVRAYLHGRGLFSRVVIGFDKEGVLVIGRGRRIDRPVVVLEDRLEEAKWVAETPLTGLSLPPKLRDGLIALGIENVGALIALPRTELEHRFGAEIGKLHLRLSGACPIPIQAAPYVPPVEVGIEVDPPDDDVTRLLFGIKGALHRAIDTLTPRGEAVAAIELRFTLDDKSHLTDRIELATATREAAIALELVRLRLGSISLPGRVTFITLLAVPERNHVAQLGLGAAFLPSRGPDLDAANRALARIRAAFGAASVNKLVVRSAHLPEAQIALAPLDKARAPRIPRRGAPRRHLAAIRRLLAKPKPLPAAIPTAPEEGPRFEDGSRVTRWFGPHRLSGAWWARLVERDYFYAETDRGAILWLYFDRRRKSWFLHGHVD